MEYKVKTNCGEYTLAIDTTEEKGRDCYSAYLKKSGDADYMSGEEVKKAFREYYLNSPFAPAVTSFTVYERELWLLGCVPVNGSEEFIPLEIERLIQTFIDLYRLAHNECYIPMSEIKVNSIRTA